MGATSAFAHADLRDIDALKAAVASIRGVIGPITALVNNAARDDRHATEEVTPEYFDERIAVNFRHQFLATQAVLPLLHPEPGDAGPAAPPRSLHLLVGTLGEAALLVDRARALLDRRWSIASAESAA